MEIVATSRLLWVFGGPGGICIIGTKTLIRGPSTRNSVIMGREHIKRTRPSVTDRQSHSTDLAEPFLEVVAGQGTRAYSGLRDVYDRNPYDKALVMRLCGSSAHKSRRQGRPHSCEVPGCFGIPRRRSHAPSTEWDGHYGATFESTHPPGFEVSKRRRAIAPATPPVFTS